MKEKLLELGKLSTETTYGFFAFGYIRSQGVWKINFCNAFKMVEDKDPEKAVDKAIELLKTQRKKKEIGIPQYEL